MKGIHYVVVGAIVCLISAFTPILSFPILGDANLLSIMPELAYGLIGFSVLALILASTEAHRFAFFPGIGNGLVALAVLIYFFDFQHRISELAERGAEEGGFVGNLVNGLSEAASIATTLLWGWPVLLVGAGLIVFGANKASEEHLNYLAETDDVDEIINEILERDAESAEYGYHSEDGHSGDADEGYQTYRPSKVPLGLVIGLAILLVGGVIVWLTLGGTETDPPEAFVVTGVANVRSAPTTEGSEVLSTLEPGETISGGWVLGSSDPSSRWLRLAGHNPEGFVWEGNLAVLDGKDQRISKGDEKQAEEPVSINPECPYYDEQECAAEELADNSPLNSKRRSLIKNFNQLDGECRGTSGDLASTWHSCAKRSVLEPRMREAGLCYGRETDGSAADAFWHVCRPGSFGYSDSPTSIPTGRCRVTLAGAAPHEGPCFIDLQSDGSFWVMNLKQTIFASVDRSGEMAEAMLAFEGNEGIGDGRFGKVSRDGACWRNEIVNICAWAKR